MTLNYVMTAAMALRAKIDRKSAILLQGGQFDPEFQVELRAIKTQSSNTFVPLAYSDVLTYTDTLVFAVACQRAVLQTWLLWHFTSSFILVKYALIFVTFRGLLCNQAWYHLDGLICTDLTVFILKR